MYLKKVSGKRAVVLLDGGILTQADLPPRDTQRWVASRKLKVVRAVTYGLLEQSEAEAMYGLSSEEFSEWVKAVALQGVAGLKVTGHKK